jgi:HlyD family secretion protein
MMNNKLIKILAVVLALLIIVLVVAKNKGWLDKRNEIQVAVQPIAYRTITEKVGTNGKIYPVKEVKLSVEISGEVTQILVAEGDSVNKGDLLLVLNPSTYNSSVSRADAAYNQSLSSLSSAQARNSTAKAQYIIIEKDYKRKQELLQNNVISMAEFEAIESQYYSALGEKEAASLNVQAAQYAIESAKATLNESREILSKTKLYAPMSGIVSKLNVELGEKVVGTAQMSGTELITIANLNQMELLVDVGENDVLRINTGDTAEIEVDAYANQKFVGIVSDIAYTSNQSLDQQITKFQVKNIDFTKFISASNKAKRRKSISI